jgi:hypothetical protein
VAQLIQIFFRKDLSKAAAVERNRNGLETFLRQLLGHEYFRSDPDVTEFLLLSSKPTSNRSPQQESVPPASAFAMPAVKSPENDSSDELEADTVDVVRSPQLAVRNGGHWSESPELHNRRAPPPAGAPRHDRAPACTEPQGTVWVGAGEFPAP